MVLADSQVASYNFLLGMYLGDGCLNGSNRVDIYHDAQYPVVIAATLSALTEVFPEGSVRERKRANANCVVTTALDASVSLAFPQHGSGPKHKRHIALTQWQKDYITQQPSEFLKGLIWSDGCRYTEKQIHSGKTYTYPKYSFSNRSRDILHIFNWACELNQVTALPISGHQIKISKRAEVRRMDELVGPKTPIDTESYWASLDQSAPTPSQCRDCFVPITRGAHTCRSCRPGKQKILWPTQESLRRSLKTTSYTALARELGVSVAALKKHL